MDDPRRSLGLFSAAGLLLREERFQAERDLDIIQKEITEFLGNMVTGNVSHEVVDQTRHQVRMADEYESISDYITNILKLNLKMHDYGQYMSNGGLDEMLDLHKHVAEYIQMINEAVELNNTQILDDAMVKGKDITHIMKRYRSNHLERVEQGKASALKSLIFTDMLNAYRRIKDHALNIAEVLSGEK